ncbi:hypothetical protein P879_08759 [Paragonimus westermani]|uniref:Uncharacterized protein n=1 Tax=Paragonimus westermani TaxID=34504 RepID=A0A8T0DF43_9TREM|nr:hypothetical protein P879_08759 [Paragonimus westermani]
MHLQLLIIKTCGSSVTMILLRIVVFN